MNTEPGVPKAIHCITAMELEEREGELETWKKRHSCLTSTVVVAELAFSI